MPRFEDSASPHTTSRVDEDVHHAGESSTKRKRLGTSNYGSGRVTNARRKTACQSCRMRKVKCDAVRPTCRICRASSTVCHYTDPFPEKLSLETATNLLCSKLDRLQNGLDKLHDLDRRSHSNAVGNEEGNRHHFLLPDRPHHSSTMDNGKHSKELFQQIPPQRTTADTVLTWEVFEGKYPPMALVGALFTPFEDEPGPGIDCVVVPGGLVPPNEEQIPQLVDRFLQNVHTKNPVLDVEELVKQARIIASNGLGWDAWSCLVLMASALGAIAKPFDAAFIVSPSPSAERGTSATWIPDALNTDEELQQAESCFVLACRRLGTLKHSILGSQCYFFAGVYLMYTLRPLLSWQYFIQASNLFQLYMKRNYGLAADICQLGHLPIQYGETSNKKRKRLEESMYWSCFKSESEFRVELPLPQSEIASYYHPHMFPSPPSPPGHGMDGDQRERNLSEAAADTSPRGTHATNLPSPYASETLSLRRHAKQLCNEEESWYYYLTEIALRRIGNRIINTFFDQHVAAWLDVRPLLSIALEFDTQVSAWSGNLPEPMQHWETNYTIRAPGSVSPVSRELSWATENRLLEMRSWLYQPFLYYFVHKGLERTHPGPIPNGPNSANTFMSRAPSREEFVNAAFNWTDRFSPEDATALYHLITNGIECNLTTLDYRSLRHRHHGLWYDMRSLMCASLILLAVIKSGQEAWLPGGAEVLWGATSPSHPHEHSIAGKIGHVLLEFDSWTNESPDLKRHRDVLEDVTRMVQDDWARRRGQ